VSAKRVDVIMTTCLIHDTTLPNSRHTVFLLRKMERLYFIRIGGTAMGGVAGACRLAGDEVMGSEEDLYEPMKTYLEKTSVKVFRTFDSRQRGVKRE
jgi:UDP-N-acetylmuramate-alanine ligase